MYKILHKIQPLLNDLRDILLGRRYHAQCRKCAWTVRNAEHESDVIARIDLHVWSAHPGLQQSLDAAAFQGYPLPPLCSVWHTRA